MPRFRDLGLSARIYRLSGTVIFIFLLVIGWLFLHLRSSLLEARDREICNVVELGWGIIDFHLQQAAAGKLSQQEAQSRALELLRHQRFEGNNYFWVNDFTPRVILHPTSPALAGQDMGNYADAEGRFLFREIVRKVENEGAGYVHYFWPKPGTEEPGRKVSYVKGIPSWGWIIGAGYSLDDIDGYVQRLFLSAATVLLLVTGGAILLVIFVSRSISVPVSRAVQMIEALGKGDLSHRLQLDQADEVGRLAKAMDAFADNLEYEILTAFQRLATGDFTFEAKGLIRDPLAKTNTQLNALVEQLQAAISREREEKAKSEALINAIGDGVAIFDAELRLIYQNPSHQNLVGDLVGSPCYRGYQCSGDPCRQCVLKRSLDEGCIHQMERRLEGQKGSRAFLDAIASPVRDAQGKVVAVIELTRDITARKKSEEHVKHLALHDPLTGLANRALLKDRLQQALARAARHHGGGAVFFMDLDRFKVINDSLGHAAGDLLLQQVAERLGELLREEDTVSRFGGDEFILLFPQVEHPNDAARIAEKIQQTLTHPFEITGKQIFITFSIGISLYPEDGGELETLIRNADTAMYYAKGKGRNNYQFFRPEMAPVAQERLTLENDLRLATERNEFELHYQPQVSLATGEIIGVEALIRWRHPQHGMLYPAKFIHVAEETGQIEAIGAWVLRTACLQNMEWQKCGYPPVKMAVNVSGRQFRQIEFTSVVEHALEESDLDPKWLELELTENVVMENVRESIMTMIDLRARNISLSIDDFGTGYSSLSYLKQFPINKLKIDRFFVVNICTNKEDAAIADAIITLSKAMQLEVVAEGVETAQQMKFLRAHPITGVQGYYFSPPVPAEEMGRMLKEPDVFKGMLL